MAFLRGVGAGLGSAGCSGCGEKYTSVKRKEGCLPIIAVFRVPLGLLTRFRTCATNEQSIVRLLCLDSWHAYFVAASSSFPPSVALHVVSSPFSSVDLVSRVNF